MTRKRLAPLEEARTGLRRTQILDAATRVFAEKGYHRATMKDVARTADIAEGTIYRYFASKTELLISMLRHLDDQTTQAGDLAAGLALSPRDLLRNRLESDLARLGPRFDLMVAVLPEVLADPSMRSRYYERIMLPSIDGIAGHLAARKEAGESGVRDVAMAARIFVASMLGLEIMSVLGDKTVRAAWKDPAGLAESMAQVLFDGLQARRRT